MHSWENMIYCTNINLILERVSPLNRLFWKSLTALTLPLTISIIIITNIFQCDISLNLILSWYVQSILANCDTITCLVLKYRLCLRIPSQARPSSMRNLPHRNGFSWLVFAAPASNLTYETDYFFKFTTYFAVVLLFQSNT